MTTYNRLTFETPRGDEDLRSQRLIKGLGREISTPKESIPYSVEGSLIYERVDSPLSAAVKNRNEVAAICSSYAPLVKFNGAALTYDTDLYAVMQSIRLAFNDDAEPVPPEVFNE